MLVLAVSIPTLLPKRQSCNGLSFCFSATTLDSIAILLKNVLTRLIRTRSFFLSYYKPSQIVSILSPACAGYLVSKRKQL